MPKEPEELIIMYDDPDIAQYRTDIKGWVTKAGRFWGNDEHMARWESCTHVRCKCGNIISKSYTMCDACREKKYIERYEKHPKKKWDGIGMLYSDAYDRYFGDWDDVLDFCANEGMTLKLDTLRLIICEPNHPSLIEEDYWSDDFPDGSDDSLENLCPELAKLVAAVNDYILREKPVLSWSPGKFAADLGGEVG